MAERDGDRVWKHIQPWNRVYLENTADTGCNLVPSYYVERPYEYPPLSSNTTVPSLGMPSGLSHVTYHSFPGSSSSSTAFPLNPSSHNRFINQRMVHSEEYGFIDPRGYERGSHKRKWPSMPVNSDPRNAAGYFHVGSSYSNMHQKTTSGSQHLHRGFDPITYNSQIIEPSRQGFQRSIRFRCSHAPHLDPDVLRNHFPIDPSSNPRSIGNLPCSSTTRQRNHGHASLSNHGKAPFYDPGTSTSEMYQFHYGSSSSNVPHAGDGIHRNSVQCRNVCLFAAHGPSQSAGASSSTHDQREASSSRPMPSFYLPPEVVATSSVVSEDISRRWVSISRSESQHNRGRSGRIRESYGRFHSVSTTANSHGRWMPRGYMGVGQGFYYEPSISLDRHDDMRLDVDNMSYEELIALGERIGSVNTGLSDDIMSTCLTRTIFGGPLLELEDDLDAKRCAICLEDYEADEEMGDLKCGHGYHLRCIRKWLEIKNSCPICKAPALEK